MAKDEITWGKPLIEFGVTGAEDAEPTEFKAMPTAKENTVLLTTVKGSAQELYGEGHELVARKMQKSYKQLALSVFVPSGTQEPIEDEDGVISDNYAVRLTPENAALTGFIMRKCSVEVEEVWSSAEGKILNYIFSSLKPKTGKMIEKYVKGGEVG